jgi:hypothetical protein
MITIKIPKAQKNILENFPGYLINQPAKTTFQKDQLDEFFLAIFFFLRLI